jgi:beta-1,4-mannosyl-glycoprotein beta-1,4-N-acetylglucosaminyltransferase
MKIYDCFQFFDEEMLLDLRLNIMDKYVDKFVITEATYMHNGKSKKLVFDINKFSKFRDKIIYIVVDEQPPDILKINETDNDEQDTKGQKLILNGYKRDNYQRQMAQEALNNAEPDDWIIINDIDEIPNLKNINFNKVKNKLLIFKQKIFYYKFNLLYPTSPWFGSRACKKKNLISPQWLRDLKHKKYPLWRVDILFSNKKYNNIFHIDNGGWHFTNIKSPEDIEKKLLNYTHHDEFERSGLKLNDLKKRVKEKKAIYNLNVDQKEDKWSSKTDLLEVELSIMPDYLKNNYKKYIKWLDI